MEAWKEYFEKAKLPVERVYDTQGENIDAAANILASCTKNGGIIHVFGAGHSNIISEEVFYRSATLANVHAIFESSVAGINQATQTGALEKIEGIGQDIVDYQRLSPPDAMICISNSGNNAVTIDIAKASKEKGLKVIAITNVDYGDELETLHSGGVKLKDVADVVIDNCSVIGDAVVKLEGLDPMVGPSSTIPNIYIINGLLVQTCEKLLDSGMIPDVYYNGHLAYTHDESDSAKVKNHNEALKDKYFWKIRNL